jgi:putative Mg2+ transporter-C (MgtC) family protein
VDPGHVNWKVFWELLWAAALAGVVGLDRELHNKSAGLRTHMIVGLGAAAFTSMGIDLIAGDPSRIVTGVATGIGFLGAGCIMKSEAGVEGITTAAGIWVVGAIGAACGIGAYSLAISTTVLAAIILVLVARIESFIKRKKGSVA